jgi:hypothetical protein
MFGRLNGFASSTGSSRCQMASVGRWSRLNNAAPSLQPHYGAFNDTTRHSVPVLGVGTLALAVVAACGFSRHATGVTERRFSRSVRQPDAYMPDAAWAVSGHRPS